MLSADKSDKSENRSYQLPADIADDEFTDNTTLGMDTPRCTAYGRVWHTNDRPGTLSECDNRCPPPLKSSPERTPS